MNVKQVDKAAGSLNEHIFRTASMTDKEIANRAYASGIETSKKSASGKVLKALPALAVAGVALTSGIITKGKLSGKCKSMAYTVGTFAVVSAVYDGMHSIFRKMREKNELAQETHDRYPTASALTRIGASFGASVLALRGARKGIANIAKKFPNIAANYKKMSNNIANLIDKSKLSNVSDSITKGLKNFADKYPKTSSFAKRNSFILLLLGYAGLSTMLIAKNEKDRQKATQLKANELCNQRLQAQNIVKKTGLNTTNV